MEERCFKKALQNYRNNSILWKPYHECFDSLTRICKCISLPIQDTLYIKISVTGIELIILMKNINRLVLRIVKNVS